MKTSLLRSLTLVAFAFASTAGAPAQTPAPKLSLPDASPLSTLKQRVGITDIEVVYSRPGLKGRSAFVALAPYGAIWRTGANNATRITFSTAVTVQGASLAGAAKAGGEIKAEYTRLNNDLIASLK